MIISSIRRGSSGQSGAAPLLKFKAGVRMKLVCRAEDVTVGFHPDGYRIDKTAAPMNRYTKWRIEQGNRWCDPRPVCFHSMPSEGWIIKDKFNWEEQPVLEIC